MKAGRMREAPLSHDKRGETDRQARNKGGGGEVPIGSTPLIEETTRLPGAMKKEETAGHR